MFKGAKEIPLRLSITLVYLSLISLVIASSLMKEVKEPKHFKGFSRVYIKSLHHRNSVIIKIVLAVPIMGSKPIATRW
jgi:hypothetical protein